MLLTDPTNTLPAGGNVANLIAQLLAGQGQGQVNPGGPMQGNGNILGNPAMVEFMRRAMPMFAGQMGQHGPLPTDGTETTRGNPGATGGRGGRFVWGNRTWGPNDFSQFANYLKSNGVDMAQWARAHPMAFASFNIDPRIKQLVAATAPGPQGGMPHA